MKKDTEPTIQDVLVAINAFSSHIDHELDYLKEKTTTIENQMVTKDEFYQELDQIRGRLTQTVTKDYLDDKLSDLRGEFFQKAGLLNKRTA
jgi:hypothetical protein